MSYKLSQFTHFYPHCSDPITAVWHALSMELLFLDNATAEFLQTLRVRQEERRTIQGLLPGTASDQSSAFEALEEGSILVPSGANEQEFPAQLANQMEKPRFLGVLYLMLADGCNLQCTYCFEKVGEPTSFKPMRMTREVAEAGIDLFAHLYSKYPPPVEHQPKIQLYGGEPFLNISVFKQAVEKIAELKRRGLIEDRVGVATVTNGTLITEDLASFIAEHGVSIGVSIDGPRQINNVHRKASGYSDTYEAAMHALAVLRSAGAKAGLSVTLTPEVVRDFPQVLAFLRNEAGLQYGLGFNILHHTPHLTTDAAYYESAAQCILDAFVAFRDDGVWEDRMMRKAVSFVDRKPLHADCAAIGHQIVVAPDGKIGICQDYIRERKGFGGSVFDAEYDPFDNAAFVEWSTRSPLRMPRCYGCPALCICGGGCPVSAELHSGSMWAVDSRICAHALRSLEFLIWDAYNKNAPPSQISEGR